MILYQVEQPGAVLQIDIEDLPSNVRLRTPTPRASRWDSPDRSSFESRLEVSNRRVQYVSLKRLRVWSFSMDSKSVNSDLMNALSHQDSV